MMCLMNSSYAQTQLTDKFDYDLNSDTTFIRWISKFPSSEGNIGKQGILSSIGEFLIGKKFNEVKKPISILADNPNLFWILDQGSGMIVEVNNNIGEIPKSFNKKIERFTSLIDVCSTPNKDILFTDSRLNKIYLLSEGNKRLQVLNDSLILKKPTGLAYSQTNNEIWG